MSQMQCKDVQELVSALVDGEDVDERHQAAAIHIASCPMCTALADNYRQIRQQLATGYEPGPADLADKIQARIATGKLSTEYNSHPGWRGLMQRAAIILLVLGLSALTTWYLTRTVPKHDPFQLEDNSMIASSLAAMLRASMAVISSKQGEINDPAVGIKGLDGKTVLAESVKLYRQQTGHDPDAIDAESRHGHLLRALMDSIVEVMNKNQSILNANGIAFKGFIPPVFARLVDEEFGIRARGEAEIKNTAPPSLVRNRQARPDSWEVDVMASQFLSTDWPKGKPFSATVQDKERSAFRMMVPGYYTQPCLSCHGEPKGQLDITGYPKEGGKLGDLGAAMSITLFLQSRS
jgi:Protein of unknown function (DUF3365)